MLDTSHTVGSREDFKGFHQEFWRDRGIPFPFAFAIGIKKLTQEGGKPLDVLYTVPNGGPLAAEKSRGTAAVLAHVCGYEGGVGNFEIGPDQIEAMKGLFAPFADDPKGVHPNIDLLRSAERIARSNPKTRIVVSIIDTPESAPVGIEDAYLRLHLLSHRVVRPNEINVIPKFLMPALPNVSWTKDGPIDIEEMSDRRLAALEADEFLDVEGQDKIPFLLNYYSPPGVRLADASRARLGAHLSPGTVVMQSAFVNFNAGTVLYDDETEEPGFMVEGVISQGVTVGNRSDLGGRSGIRGTMSGGGEIVISVGRRCLLGMSSSVGIPLGHYCAIESNLSLQPGMPLMDMRPRERGEKVKRILARDLSGQHRLLIYRHGLSGRVEVRTNNKAPDITPWLHGASS